MSRAESTRLPRPDEFPLGSLESRAAARAVLERREREPIIMIFGLDDSPVPDAGNCELVREPNNLIP